jgi:hypothetical protein
MQDSHSSKRPRASGDRRDGPTYMQAIQQDLPPSGASFNFNETLLRAYDLTNAAEISAVVSTVQALYQNGSEAMRQGLLHLTNSMAKKLTEMAEISRSVDEMTSKLHEIQCNSDAEIGALQASDRREHRAPAEPFGQN